VQRSAKTSRAGFTLTEVAIVMGMIGFILGAVWWAASSARETQKGNDALNEMQTVVQNIDGIMMGQTFTTIGNITNNMIGAQSVPSTYVDAATPTTADNPWSPKNFVVWSLAGGKTFRVSFYKVTEQGCVALLLKGTSCQPGQSGCPFQAGTGGTSAPVAPTAANSCKPNLTCPGEAAAAAGLGWQVMNANVAIKNLCAANSYTGAGNNSVEFDYSL